MKKYQILVDIWHRKKYLPSYRFALVNAFFSREAKLDEFRPSNDETV